MYFKFHSSLVVAVLVTLLWECLIVDAAFLRRPKDGNSCRNYRFVGQNGQPLNLDFLTYLGRDSFPCQDGTVVNSKGRCVDPGMSFEADRCQGTGGFSQARVNRICQRRPNAILADPFDCTRYYDCSSWARDKRVQCPFDPVSRTQLTFHDIDQVCKRSFEVMCGQRPVTFARKQPESVCDTNPSHVWEDMDNCNSYFNCSQPNRNNELFTPYGAECPYLQLFDAQTKTCRPYAQVNCGRRREIKNPCDLRQNQCGPGHCRPCWVENPDCTQKADGVHARDYDVYTPQYFTCLTGRTLGVSLCQSARDANGFVQPRLFHPDTKRCVPASAIPRSLGGLGA